VRNPVALYGGVQIPLSSLPAQSLRVTLSGQSMRVDVRQRESGLYLSLYRAGTPILLNRLCRDRTWLVRETYLDAPGDLTFMDLNGQSDPDYTGLTDRFVLIYVAGHHVR